MAELQRMVPKLTPIVGDRYREDYVVGFSTARIYNSSLKLNFLGGSPQVIKPAMPFTCFFAMSFHDGSILPAEGFRYDRLEIRPTVQFRSSASRTLEVREAKALPEQPGIWEFTIDLRSELAQTTGSYVGTGDKRVKDLVNEISALKLVTNYKDGSRTGHCRGVGSYSLFNRR